MVSRSGTCTLRLVVRSWEIRGAFFRGGDLCIAFGVGGEMRWTCQIPFLHASPVEKLNI
jgi:hypothetical protein